MVTREQATQLTGNNPSWPVYVYTEFHYGECTCTVGKRGAKTYKSTRVRRTGKTKTWVTRQGDFKIPVKYGLYESAYITQDNAHLFHTAQDCPLSEY